jgi:transcription-repair coupling factor (superfamily II helicase)
VVFSGLTRALVGSGALEKALVASDHDADFSVTPGLNAPLLVALLRQRADAGQPVALLAVTATSRESESLQNALGALEPGALILEFPAWETLPHERLSPSAEITGRRFDTLRRVAAWDGKQPLIVLASVRALLQPIASNLLEVEPITLVAASRGNDLDDLARRLVHLAYTRVDIVTRRGEFAVRGGILDVFSPVAEHPVRLDFFGDELETMRWFSVADQRSLDGEVERVILPPSRELLLTDAVRQRAREMEHEFPAMTGMLSKIGEGIAVEGMESLTPALVEKLVPLTEYLPPATAIAVVSPERVATRAVNLGETNREFLDAAWNAASVGATAPIDLSAGDFLTMTQIRADFAHGPWWTLSPFNSGDDDDIRVAGDSVPSFAGNVDGAIEHVGEKLHGTKELA